MLIKNNIFEYVDFETDLSKFSSDIQENIKKHLKEYCCFIFDIETGDIEAAYTYNMKYLKKK